MLEVLDGASDLSLCSVLPFDNHFLDLILLFILLLRLGRLFFEREGFQSNFGINRLEHLGIFLSQRGFASVEFRCPLAVLVWQRTDVAIID